MRGLVLGCLVVLVVGCARENPLFNDGTTTGAVGSTTGSSGRMTTAGPETAEQGSATRGGTGGSSGGPKPPPLTTGPPIVTSGTGQDSMSTTAGDEAPRTDSVGETGPAPEPTCCEPHDGPGCDEPMIDVDCVCAAHSECCTDNWTLLCVAAAQNDCGLDCGDPPPGDCCALGVEPGCEDWDTIECVCEIDAYCCNNFWDDECACVAAGTCDACMMEPVACAKPV